MPVGQGKNGETDMKRIILAALVGVGLTACAVEPEQGREPSGKDVYTMRCSGLGQTWAKCYTMARKRCPSGYYIVNRHSGTKTVLFNRRTITVPKQTLVVECK